MATKRDGLFKRGPVWWIRTDPYTRKAISTRCTDLDAARAFRAGREQLRADPSHATEKTARLADWIARVISDKERAGKSPATIQVYRQKLGHWLRLAPTATLNQVNADFVDAFWQQRRTEDVTDHTISKEVTHLLTVLKAAKRAKAYNGDLSTLRPPDLHAGYKPRKRALSVAEVNRLLSELKPELGALVATCVSLGCRLSEAYKLLPTDVDLDRGQVHIGGTKTEESDRHVPIVSIFRHWLEMALPYLPLGRLPNNLRRDISAACKRAGIANCTPNDLRRTHATMLSEKGVDRDVTRRLLGHTTTHLVDTVYGRPTPQALGRLAETSIERALPTGLYHGRDSQNIIDTVAIANPAEKPGADYQSRTDDLRFTKPSSHTGQAGFSGNDRGFHPVKQGEPWVNRGGNVTPVLHGMAALLLAYAAESALRPLAKTKAACVEQKVAK